MRRPLCLLCLTFAAVIVICMHMVPLPVPDYDDLDGQNLILEGTVYRKEYRETMRYGTVPVIYLKSVHILNELNDSDDFNHSDNLNYFNRFSGDQIQNIICSMKNNDETEPALGSTVRVKGRVRCFTQAGNPGEFDMRKYYRIMKLDFQLTDAHIIAAGGDGNYLYEQLYRLRKYFAGVLERTFEEKEASIMKAMLLGEKNGLDFGTKELYRQSSIIHILSISGLHISIIGMGIYRMLRKAGIPLKAGAVFSIAMICCYGIMTGMSMSAVRAVFMFIIHLAADMAGRTYDMLTALSMAAVLLLVQQPRYVEHSGFLFSFGAVAAIGVFLPVLHDEKRTEKGTFRRMLWKMKQAFASGMAVFLCTLPVHMMFYYQFPIYSVLLNLAVIPLMSIVMCAGLFCMVMGDLAPVLAGGAAYIDKMILWFYEWCCLLVEKIPGGIFISGEPEMWQVFAYVLSLGILAAIHKKIASFWKMLWIGGALFILLLRTEDGQQVTVLDVGQGDCIHIQSDSGKHYLIDGGSSSKGEVAKYQLLPYLRSKGVRRLEAVFVTHSDSDHCNGIISLIEGFPMDGLDIGCLILPDIGTGSRDERYREMVSLAGEKGITVQYMSRGQFIEEKEMRITCMHPAAGYETEETNETSLVLLLSYRKFTGLFTGDAEGNGEREAWKYTERYLSGIGTDGLTLLKVAHHGSNHSTKEEMLEDFMPALSLISCGKNNKYGHPHRELIERLAEAGSRIYLTTKSGAVTVGTDGENVWVNTFK